MNYTREIQLGNGNVFKTNITDAILNSAVLYLPLDWSKNKQILDHSSKQNLFSAAVQPTIIDIATLSSIDNIYGTKAVHFGAENNYIDISSVQNSIRNSSFSISAWVNPDIIAADKMLFCINSNTGGNGFRVILRDGVLRGIKFYTKKSYLLSTPFATPQIVEGAWQHLVITYDKNTYTLEAFLNGSSMGTVFLEGGISMTDNARVQIGMSYNGEDTYGYFRGNITQFGLFNRILTQQEIQLIKNEDLKYALNQPPYPDFPKVIRRNSKQQPVYSISDTLNKIEQLSGVRFKWKREDYPQYDFPDSYQLGFIIEELENVFPDLVKDNNNTDLTIALSGLIALIIEAIKVLKQESDNIVTDLANKVNALEADQQAKIADLQQRLANINSIAYE